MLNIGLDVRPDERRDTGLAALTLFGVMTAHALLETARDALVLASVPVQQLPKVYLAMAMTEQGILRLKPQNLLVSLPLADRA